MCGQRFLAGVAIVTMLAALTGCAAPTGPAFSSQGIPHDRYIVAGGPAILYRPPTAGVAVLIDRRANKVLVSQSLAEGSRFEFGPGSDIEKFLRDAGLLGNNPADAQFVLFFVPGPSATTSPVTK